MAGTFQYYPTNEERDRDSYRVVNFFRNGLTRLYWMYYIHLPYYLMENQDAALLHCFFLVLFSLMVYAVFAYLPHTMFQLLTRSYYYLTGDDFRRLLVEYGIKDRAN
ncbi:CYFA0S35e00232g1_1 [Cyberlindnera fabianii]|uniref:CYFA0S35e00232g1_1 n=1 Tax=Cyberlindnera fabianii TaxID=36022 RepID=A0A061BCC8_CYBFA|nr:CYFA0S35e00232g1_1 [Cyberlindnera fabianii]